MSRPLPRRLRDLLDVDVPLILAGMGGVAGPELVAAVSEAGGVGTLGLYKMPAERIAEALAETERRTNATYGVNFVPEVIDEAELMPRLEAVLAASRPATFVSFFGLPAPAIAEAVRAANRTLIVQVGTETEARHAVELGADALILQGTEAGGHLLGTQTVPELLRDVRARFPEMPLAVAGGVASGETLARLGDAQEADGVCCGTLFLPARESRAHPLYKQEVLRAGAEDTAITELFDFGWPGRRHRVIRTPRVERGRDDPAAFIARTEVYGRPLPISRYSAAVPTTETSGEVGEMALYCGTSCQAIDAADRPAHDIVTRFADEYRTAPAP